jgi:hypothetical protein
VGRKGYKRVKRMTDEKRNDNGKGKRVQDKKVKNRVHDVIGESLSLVTI